MRTDVRREELARSGAGVRRLNTRTLAGVGAIGMWRCDRSGACGPMQAGRPPQGPRVSAASMASGAPRLDELQL